MINYLFFVIAKTIGNFRRGFTFQGGHTTMAAPPAEEEIKIRGEGDACAYYFW
jgi:hypothetical protein